TPPAPSVLYTLSLHDALPIFRLYRQRNPRDAAVLVNVKLPHFGSGLFVRPLAAAMHQDKNQMIVRIVGQRLPSARAPALVLILRSEEHTSELQSQSNLVCRLL